MNQSVPTFRFSIVVRIVCPKFFRNIPHLIFVGLWAATSLQLGGVIMTNKPGTTYVGTIPKAQKQHKDFRVSRTLFYSTLKTLKLDRTGALKGEDLSDFLTSILWQNIKKLKKGPSGDNKNLSEKISQCHKTERGPFSLTRYCMLR